MSSDVLSKSNSIVKPQIQLKIVFWGPGESGKTTNFYRLSEHFHAHRLGKAMSIETSDGRTLWKDSVFLRFNLPFNNSNRTLVTQVVTATGQLRLLDTRRYVLDKADGAIFVGDSDPDKLEENKRSFRELIALTNLMRIPYVVQLNKRDLKDAISEDKFKLALGLPKEEKFADGLPVVYKAIATKGINVIVCFHDLIIIILEKYKKIK